MSVQFAGRDPASPFLEHVGREFHNRGTQLRTDLSRKSVAKRHLADLDIIVPAEIAALDDIDALTPEMLGARAALKYAHGHSARGVMLLERMGDDLWFDHLNQKMMDLEAIKASQKRVLARLQGRPGWIVEEAIPPQLDGRPIPFDYKFYCFRDQIAFVAQMDRNTYPMNVTLLDEHFAPLAHRRDYILIQPKHRPGLPIPPRHGTALRYWARRLSIMTDSPFVRIDLYDGAAGPVFGEFTFSPGTTHRKWWLYSDKMLARLNALFVEGEGLATPDLGPPPRDLDPIMPDARLYSLWASAFAAGKSGAAAKLAAFYERAAKRAPSPLSAEAANAARAWKAAREVMRARDDQALAGRREFALRHSSAPGILDRRG